jgi:hypothetical protein
VADIINDLNRACELAPDWSEPGNLLQSVINRITKSKED